MIQINCNNCKTRCCGEIKNLRPVLLPSEEEKFKQYSEEINTKFRTLYLLKQNQNCIFFKENKCTIYKNRPFECQIYPFLLDFSKKEININLDKRFCKSLSSLKADKEKIFSCIKTLKFPEDWIKAYKRIDSIANAF